MKHFTFLKGINVGGNRKVDMKRLKTLLDAEGFAPAVTFLNSGNVLVESGLSPREIEGKIRGLVADRLGVDPVVICRSPSELRDILENLPYSESESDESKQLVYFFDGEPDPEGAERIKRDGKIIEPFVVRGGNLLVYYPAGVGRSPFTTNYIDRVFAVNSTGRTVKTIRLLVEKGGG